MQLQSFILLLSKGYWTFFLTDVFNSYIHDEPTTSPAGVTKAAFSITLMKLKLRDCSMTALNNPSPPYYQADNRLTQSRFTTLILSSLTAALKEPSVPVALARSVFTDWMGWRSVCARTVKRVTERTQWLFCRVQYAKWECVWGEIILVCFEGAGRTDGVCVCVCIYRKCHWTKTPPYNCSSQSLLLDKRTVTGNRRVKSHDKAKEKKRQITRVTDKSGRETLLTFCKCVCFLVSRDKKRERCWNHLEWFP